MLTATFQPVGREDSEAVLGDIKANRAFMFGSDTVQTLRSNGSTKGLYTFCTAEEGAGYGIKEGWYDYDYINNEWDWESQPPMFDSTELPFGTMIIVSTGYDEAELNFAGQVLAEDKDFEPVVGEWNMLGNATPVDLTLADISANRTFMFGSDTLQTLNGNGSTKGLYTFCTAEEGAGYGITAGWYDYDYINNEWDWESQPPTCNTVDIPAGLGFIVQTGYEGSVITIPSAL